ncbi:MAG: hypothetical protein ABGY24_17925 [bacterium]
MPSTFTTPGYALLAVCTRLMEQVEEYGLVAFTRLAQNMLLWVVPKLPSMYPATSIENWIPGALYVEAGAEGAPGGGGDGAGGDGSGTCLAASAPLTTATSRATNRERFIVK